MTFLSISFSDWKVVYGRRRGKEISQQDRGEKGVGGLTALLTMPNPANFSGLQDGQCRPFNIDAMLSAVYHLHFDSDVDPYRSHVEDNQPGDDGEMTGYEDFIYYVNCFTNVTTIYRPCVSQYKALVVSPYLLCFISAASCSPDKIA